MSLLTAHSAPPRARTPTRAATLVPDQSRAERTTSYAVADFPCPRGREEEWRFTPVDRLGALFSRRGSADARRRPCESERCPRASSCSSLALDDAARRQRLPPRLTAPRSPPGPAQRAARCSSTSRPRPSSTSRCVVRLHRHRRRAACTATPSSRPGGISRATVVLEHTGTARAHAGNVEIVVGDGADLTVVTCRSGTTTRSTSPSTTPLDRPRRHGSSTSSSPSAASIVRVNTNAALRRARRPSRSSASTSPTPASTSSTGSSSTTRRRTASRNVDVQGRAAGRRRAHRLGRRRADPGERPRAPTPTSSTATWCSPTAPAPTRCRTSRSRPARSSGAGHASRHRPLRRRAAVLPAGARHPRGRGPPARRARLLRRASSAGSACPRCRSACMAAIERRARAGDGA